MQKTVWVTAYTKELRIALQSLDSKKGAPSSRALKFSAPKEPNQSRPWETSTVVFVAAVSIQKSGKTEKSAKRIRKI